ncbi:putative EamA domain-containing protein [Helianthus annuus]|uniref:WAT1-related protein n=1 Tax=Helianthus annuus TaxID=4232 RepID=A0A251VRD1_HELAN|nr:WAT1-related protein At2g37460 [Helianthus annuus]KAF5823550.1 putative EamA domain-containing protein [Helianthus annuus]KAJ0612877.1 putative EamA domain-containing protein [Helianthus annuus]KAJ0624508.1 putative EamA domain-containing protein [Helianthus annuus]KAJ0628264.1 putative EamA domain-containing protein [Helianthus annuus]KAJ0784550.1 putative EamA domain-containing protein [Helianthus annuus]
MSMQVASERMSEFFRKGKPFFAVIFLQFGFAGMSVLSKVALNEGMSNYVFVVYRHVVATIVIAPFALVLDKKIRPKMTKSIFMKLMLLALLEPVIDQNLFFLGMKATTATFAVSMSNVLPAITFVLACILRLEVVNLKSIRSQAKVVGTITTIAGAMVMTLVKGPVLELFWTKGRHSGNVTNNGVDLHHSLKGAIMITIGIFSWACFMVLQAITLKSYPVALSLTAWICFLGSIEGSIVALVMERGNYAVWAIKWDTTLLATLYSGIICSGLAYYIQGIIMKDRGPVFVTAFSPLSMIIVAVMGSIILAEQTYLGRVLGAIVIVAGLYMVVWGKSKDKELPTDGKVAPEEQILDKESEQNDCHKIITIIKSADGVCDKDNQTVDVCVTVVVEPSTPSIG